MREQERKLFGWLIMLSNDDFKELLEHILKPNVPYTTPYCIKETYKRYKEGLEDEVVMTIFSDVFIVRELMARTEMKRYFNEPYHVYNRQQIHEMYEHDLNRETVILETYLEKYGYDEALEKLLLIETVNTHSFLKRMRVVCDPEWDEEYSRNKYIHGTPVSITAILAKLL